MTLSAAMLEDERRVWKTWEDFDYGETPYGRTGQQFEDRGGARTGMVGGAQSHLCPVRELVDYAAKALKLQR